MNENTQDLHDALLIQGLNQHFLAPETQTDILEHHFVDSLDSSGLEHLELFEALLQEKDNEHSTIASLVGDSCISEEKCANPQMVELEQEVIPMVYPRHLTKGKKIAKERKASAPVQRTKQAPQKSRKTSMKLPGNGRSKAKQTCGPSCLENLDITLGVSDAHANLDANDEIDPFLGQEKVQKMALLPLTTPQFNLDYESFISLN